MAMVLGATFLYGSYPRKKARPPPISLGSFEKTLGGAATPLSDTPTTGKQYLTVEPLDSVRAISTSRPSSPKPAAMHHPRLFSTRLKKPDEE